jgi:hypothetical protein
VTQISSASQPARQVDPLAVPVGIGLEFLEEIGLLVDPLAKWIPGFRVAGILVKAASQLEHGLAIVLSFFPQVEHKFEQIGPCLERHGIVT